MTDKPKLPPLPNLEELARLERQYNRGRMTGFQRSKLNEKMRELLNLKDEITDNGNHFLVWAAVVEKAKEDLLLPWYTEAHRTARAFLDSLKGGTL